MTSTATTTPAPHLTLVDVMGLGTAVMAAGHDQPGLVYFTTECCGATGKGSGQGIVCRSCYQPVAEHYGWAGLVEEDATTEALAAILEPVLERFAQSVASRAMDRARLSLSRMA